MDQNSFNRQLRRPGMTRSHGHSRGKKSPTKPAALSVVVLGASGDLAKKKTFPALFALFSQGWATFHSASSASSSFVFRCVSDHNACM
jgi:hypothetical protein